MTKISKDYVDPEHLIITAEEEENLKQLFKDQEQPQLSFEEETDLFDKVSKQVKKDNDKEDNEENKEGDKEPNYSAWTNADIVMDILEETKLSESLRVYLSIHAKLIKAMGYAPTLYSLRHGWYSDKLKVIDGDLTDIEFRDINHEGVNEVGKNYGGWGGSYYNYPETTVKKDVPKVPVKTEYKEVTNLAHNIIINLPTHIWVKIYYMMVEKQHLEWSAYFIYSEPLPSIKDLLRNKVTEKKNTITIHVEDMIFVPQKVTSGHVDGLEIEYPEFMQPIYKAQVNGKLSTGRIHSHNTMGAFHSGVDNNEFKKNLEIGQSFFSIVVSLKGKKFNKIEYNAVERTRENIASIVKKMSFDVKIGKPTDDPKTIEYGYLIKGTTNHKDIFESKSTKIKPYLIGAKKWVNDYNDMINIISETEKTFSIIEKMKDNKSLDLADTREIRSTLLSSKPLLKTFNLFSHALKGKIKDNNDLVVSNGKFKNKVIELAKGLGLELSDQEVKPTNYSGQYYRIETRATSVTYEVLPKYHKDIIEGVLFCPQCEANTSITFQALKNYIFTFDCNTKTCNQTWEFQC